MVPTQKSSAKFHCILCDYSTSRKSQYERHLLTDKHNILQNPTSEKFGTTKTYVCHCGKAYKHSSTLYAHRKTCFATESLPNIGYIKSENNSTLIDYLIKENKEMKELVLEIVKNGTNNNNNNNNTNITHTNSHNKAFNLNFFLNETCKNAMNITDFVDSIRLQLSDFMNVGEVGFIEGISNIIVNNLNSLDETIRPIHCTDQKRETFYVKDENIWEKDDENKKKIRKMIKNVAFKNEKLMKTYKETYPDYNDPDSHRSDQYSKTVIEAMDCKEESHNKIIKNISKATTINKSS